MNTFFAFEDSFSGEQGFSLFSSGHLLWLTGVLAAALFIGRVYAHSTRSAKLRADYAFGSILLILELAYNAVLYVSGHLTVYMLPMHLCAISVLLCIIQCFTNVHWLGQYMYFVGLPGALCALLFPDWTNYPFLNYFCISGFLIHGLLVIRSWTLLRSRMILPNKRGLITSIATVFSVAIPVYIFNRHYNTNYFFLMRPSEGSPLEAIQELFGSRCYLLGFFILFLAVELILYLPWKFTKNN